MNIPRDFIAIAEQRDQLKQENEKLRKQLSQRLQQLEEIRAGILDIAESRPMSAMTRLALRELAGSPGQPNNG